MSTLDARSRGTGTLFVVAALTTLGAVILGSVVCATDSSAACPNWPGCYPGQIGPEAHLNPVLEFVHRVVAVSTGPLLLVAALLGLRDRNRLVRFAPWLALVGALVAGVLGMLTVTRGISKTAAAIDLGFSLVAMIAITLAAVLVLRGPATWRPRRAPLAWAAVGALFGFHILSIFVAGPGSLTRCVSWPVWRQLDADGTPVLQWLRLALAAVAVVLAVFTAVRALRRRDTRMIAAVVLLLIVTELILGLTVLAGGGAGTELKGLYAALAGAILGGLTWIATLSSTDPEKQLQSR
ncbi:MAG: cytochrome oxidase assembly protein [Propionibacterium sp.]|nr:cytochrome oxidase assembly protein [Propionibacterium sp.]